MYFYLQIMSKILILSLVWEHLNSLSLSPGANVIKLFLSLIYGFSYKTRVFIRLVWKNLPMTITVAYYEDT
jgi:hypothetical protein